MPYITAQQRQHIDLDGFDPENAGQLNYVITKIISDYFRMHHNYQGINDIIGALEGAKLEFYRRKVVDYENSKILENGDVYT